MKWLEDAFKNNIGAIVVGIFSVIGMYTTMQVSSGKQEVSVSTKLQQLDSYNKSNYSAIRDLQSDMKLLQLGMENQKVQLENVKGENAKLTKTLDKFSDSVNNLAQSVSALQAITEQNTQNAKKK
ncbi:putative holin [Escherichia phage SUSP2]|uniref:Holin n=3 Tax=Mooglevirus TaxID=1985303 RepID=A0A0N9S111_9CAUD|nr:putative holin [Escherichia phage phiSUSP1]YP_009211063.1 putative holin [Escherichia phage SUSP2]ALH47058.1 putative holin [Escherichia phage phiSUSP1]ALH47188.1 putative holin [Escherichia phage SUSP2]QBP33008.1 putative holin [Enterobacteria phage CHB7]